MNGELTVDPLHARREATDRADLVVIVESNARRQRFSQTRLHVLVDVEASHGNTGQVEDHDHVVALPVSRRNDLTAANLDIPESDLQLV
jgi:hypothetical protein